MELPEEVRGEETIPAVIAEILDLIGEGRSLEDMRKQGMVHAGEWHADVLY